MAAPNTSGPIASDKLGAVLDEVEEELTTLQVLYEKYFLGIDRRPPDQQRKRVSTRLRELRAMNPRNTGLKFRVNTLFNRLLSYERMWDRTLKEIEDGTYRRDVFKAKYRQEKRKDAKPEAPPPPSAPPTLSDDKLRRLYDTYLIARQRTGEPTQGITFEAVAERIRAQVPVLMEKHKARDIEFKVVIKGGKAILKAVPKA